jgi:arginyl-tRNA synthetase
MILGAEGSVRDSRVCLTGMTAQVLKKGLYLIGVKAPERM